MVPVLSLSPSPSSSSVIMGGGPSRTISTGSIQSIVSLTNFGIKAEVDSAVREEGLRHAKVKLEARKYKTPSFASQLLECIQLIRISSWVSPSITQDSIKVDKVSGSLTNAVFFVSCPTLQGPKTLLLRIYGLSSGSLISRPRELHTLHVLSSQYHIGPRVYGTFENGRVEEYFESTTLTPSDIRDPTISRWIGARMAELHSVDIEAIEQTSTSREEGKRWEIGVRKNVKSWLVPAADVLALPSVSDTIRAEFDLNTFKEDWKRYMTWLSTVDDVTNGSRRVFAHNDTQYGNLLRLQHPKEFVDEHRQIIVVDFEYASPNPASFDIANHFHEWTADYHCSTPHLLDPSRYPTFEERRNFYTAYIGHTATYGEYPIVDEADHELQLKNLDEQVRFWSPSSHGMWAIWGLVQAREDVEAGTLEPEFDYISYSRCRMAAFRQEIRSLGL
ncbi:choline kinase, cytoplasm [Collybia nuda]|uniref:Choline kinase, cytoplasm n=1 Tax=Collybia nuda TaxID=64659 RepID=A0A9P5XZA7_9AGAR|nr:choline kinase, cytoplasm [Collybia nuda]